MRTSESAFLCTRFSSSLNLISCSRLRAIMERMAERLPTPIEDEHRLPDDFTSIITTLPTTLRAAIRMFPQTKMLTQGEQELSVAIEVEGVLHNRRPLPNATIDVIFIVDNGYISAYHPSGTSSIDIPQILCLHGLSTASDGRNQGSIVPHGPWRSSRSLYDALCT